MVKLPEEAAVTVSETLVVWVTPPPVPVTVMLYVPVAVVDATVMVMVELPDPGAAIEVGLKPTVTPEGWPLADNEMAELNPPDTVVEMLEVPLLPCTTERELGLALMVKFGLAALLTVRATVAVCVMLSPVPVTVML